MLGILDDEDGYIWVGAHRRAFSFNPRTATCRPHQDSDGLPTDLYGVLVVAAKSPSGEMFFGSYSGLEKFFPKQVMEHQSKPPGIDELHDYWGGGTDRKGALDPANLVHQFDRVVPAKYFFASFFGVELCRSSADAVPVADSTGSNRNETTDSSHRTATYTTLRQDPVAGPSSHQQRELD